MSSKAGAASVRVLLVECDEEDAARASALLAQAAAPAFRTAEVVRVPDAGAALEMVPGTRSLRGAMARLAARGVTSLVLEGGRRLHEAAWRAGVVDRVQVYVAPVEIGREGVAWMDRGEVLGALDTLQVRTCGPDVRLEGDVHRTH